MRATATADGGDRDVVFAAAVSASDSLRELVLAKFDEAGGPITAWSADALRVWSERPWSTDGTISAPVHHSRVDFTITFSDLGVLSTWLESAVAVASVAIDSIEWELTESTLAEEATKARDNAVRDAVARATEYAHSLGLSTLTPLAIADRGMLDAASNGGGPIPLPRRSVQLAAFAGGDVRGLELRPQRIAVASVVDARFAAS